MFQPFAQAQRLLERRDQGLQAGYGIRVERWGGGLTINGQRPLAAKQSEANRQGLASFIFERREDLRIVSALRATITMHVRVVSRRPTGQLVRHCMTPWVALGTQPILNRRKAFSTGRITVDFSSDTVRIP